MGLIVSIYTDKDGYDCTNNGISKYAKGFTLVDVDGPFEPNVDYPAATLRVKEPLSGCKCLYVTPVENEGEWTMFGGNLAYTSDSRFTRRCEELLGHYFFGAVKIFDRVEK